MSVVQCMWSTIQTPKILDSDMSRFFRARVDYYSKLHWKGHYCGYLLYWSAVEDGTRRPPLCIFRCALPRSGSSFVHPASGLRGLPPFGPRLFLALMQLKKSGLTVTVYDKRGPG